MPWQSVPRERALYFTTVLITALVLALVPFLGLAPDETRAILTLAVVGVVYRIALLRMQVRFGWARLAPLAVPINVSLITLAFVILSRVLPTFWVIYFVLPLVSALIYGKVWAYLSGLLAALGYLVVVIGNRAMTLESPEELLNAGVLLIFTVLAGRLTESERRHTREQEALTALAGAVNQTLTREDVLNIAADQIIAAARVDAVAIFTLEHDELVLRAQRGSPPPVGGFQPEFLEQTRIPRADAGLLGQTVQTGKMQVVTEGSRRDPRVASQVVRRSEFEAYVGVPLMARERVVGVISLASRRPRVFVADDLAFFDAIASHVATAIVNARLFDESRAHAERLALLNEFSARVNRGLELEALLVDAQQLVTRLLTLKTAWILLFEDTEKFVLAAEYGLDPALAADDKHAMRASPCRCQRMLLARELTDPVNVVQCERFERIGVTAHHASVPLKSGDRILGLLNVVTPTGEPLAPEDLQMLGAMGAQLGVAIERAQLYGQVQARRIDEQTALLKLSQTLSGLLDTDLILDRAAQAVQEIFRPTLVSLMLPDERRENLILRAGRGWEPERYGVYSVDVATSREGFAFLNGEALWLEDVQTSARFPCPRGLKEREIHSSLTAPLNAERGTLGTLCIHFREPRAFGDDDVRLLSLIANQTAIAYERARLFEEAQQFARDLKDLHSIAQSFQRIAELPTLYAHITESIARILQAEQCAVVLLDETHQTFEMQTPAFGITEEQARGFHLPMAEAERYSKDASLSKPYVMVNQPAADPRATPRLIESLNERAFVAAWLIAGDKFIGGLRVANKIGAAAFSERDGQILSTLAPSVASAIENARLFDETQHRAKEFGALYETSHDLAAQYNLSALLQTIIERAAALLKALGGLIYLYDTARHDLELAAAKGYPLPLGIHVDPNHGMASQVLKTLQPFIVDDYQHWEHRRNQLEGIPISAALQVPMLYGGELVGIIAVFEIGTSARKFTDADARLLSLFAAQAASAVHSARLYDEARQRAEQLEMLYQVGKTLNSTLDPETILERVIDETMRVVHASQGCILVVDESANCFGYRALRGFTPEEVQKTLTTPLFLDQGLNGRAYRTRQIVVVDDVSEAPDYVTLIPQTRAELVIPIIHGSKVLGNIDLQSPQIGAFQRASVGLLETLADQAAVALENAQLFEAETARRAELAALYDLSRALGDTNDIDAILNLVARRAVETIHVTFARVALVEDGECVVRAAYPVRALDRDLGVGRREAAQTMPICYRAAQQNAPVLLRRNDSALTDLERDAVFLGIAQTLCLVPLRSGERALGLLMLGEARAEEREPFTEEKIRLARSIGDQAASTLRRAELYAELEDAYLQTVLALANTVDARDSYTADHAQRLAAMALAVGREMGLGPRELEDLRYGAILHDIGKIGVPDTILKKPSKLDAEEWKVMRQHPDIGARILAPVPRLSGAARIVRHHHERYDGKGYPGSLAGETIPFGARILTVVDSYSAIVDARVYKPARSHKEAIAELKKHAGTQFDPRVVEIFLRILESGLGERFIWAKGGGEFGG